MVVLVGFSMPSEPKRLRLSPAPAPAPAIPQELREAFLKLSKELISRTEVSNPHLSSNPHLDSNPQINRLFFALKREYLSGMINMYSSIFACFFCLAYTYFAYLKDNTQLKAEYQFLITAYEAFNHFFENNKAKLLRDTITLISHNKEVNITGKTLDEIRPILRRHNHETFPAENPYKTTDILSPKILGWEPIQSQQLSDHVLLKLICYFFSSIRGCRIDFFQELKCDTLLAEAFALFLTLHFFKQEDTSTVSRAPPPHTVLGVKDNITFNLTSAKENFDNIQYITIKIMPEPTIYDTPVKINLTAFSRRFFILGDMHGSTSKMIMLLFALDFINKDHYHLGTCLCDYYNKFDSALNLEEKWQLIESFKEVLKLIEFTTADCEIIFIGDTLSDRGNCDWFTLLFYQALHKANVKFSVIFSNHDMNFMLFMEGVINNEAVIPSFLCSTNRTMESLINFAKMIGYNHKINADKPNYFQKDSSSSQVNPIIMGELIEMYKIYCQHLCLFKCVINPHTQKKYFISHAPTTTEYITAVANEFQLPPPSEQSYAAWLNELNIKFRSLILNTELHNKITNRIPATTLTEYFLTEKNPIHTRLYNFPWTRELSVGKKTSSFLDKPSKWVNVIGHVGNGSDAIKQLVSSGEIINLDINNTVGRTDCPTEGTVPYLCL